MARKDIETLESQRKRFSNTTVVDAKTLTSFRKIISLFEESQETQAQLTVATRSRRRAARNLLNTIQLTFGHEVFLLCAFSLTITALASIKDTVKFVDSIQAWWTRAVVPPGLTVVTKGLLAKYGQAFPNSGTNNQAVTDGKS